MGKWYWKKTDVGGPYFQPNPHVKMEYHARGVPWSSLLIHWGSRYMICTLHVKCTTMIKEEGHQSWMMCNQWFLHQRICSWFELGLLSLWYYDPKWFVSWYWLLQQAPLKSMYFVGSIRPHYDCIWCEPQLKRNWDYLPGNSITKWFQSWIWKIRCQL